MKQIVVNFATKILSGKISKRVLAPVLLALGVGAGEIGAVDAVKDLSKYLLPAHSHDQVGPHTHDENGLVVRSQVTLSESEIPGIVPPQLTPPSAVLTELYKAIKCE